MYKKLNSLSNYRLLDKGYDEYGVSYAIGENFLLWRLKVHSQDISSKRSAVYVVLHDKKIPLDPKKCSDLYAIWSSIQESKKSYCCQTVYFE